MTDETIEPSKDFYEALGRATFQAQALEDVLITLFATLHLSEDESHEKLREIMSAKYKQTLGKIIRDFSKKMELSEDIQEIFVIALDARNWLAHRFFREFGMAGLSGEMQAIAINKLNECGTLFEALMSECFYLVVDLSVASGESEEEIRQGMLEAQSSDVKNLIDKYGG